MVYVFLGIGFALLLLGSEAVLRGGAGLFRAVGLPPIFISLLIVSFAMSAPELSVAIQASARGMSDIALGDIIELHRKQRARFGIHGGGPELFGGHLAKALVALDGVFLLAFAHDVVEELARGHLGDDLGFGFLPGGLGRLSHGFLGSYGFRIFGFFI